MYGYELETDLGLLVDDSQIDALTNLEQLQMLVEVKKVFIFYGFIMTFLADVTQCTNVTCFLTW